MELQGTKLHMAANLQHRVDMRHELATKAARALYDFYLRASTEADDSELLYRAFDRAIGKLINLRLAPDREVPRDAASAVEELSRSLNEITDPSMQRLWLGLYADMVTEQLTSVAAPASEPIRTSPAGIRWWTTFAGRWQVRSDAELLLTYQAVRYVSWMKDIGPAGAPVPGDEYRDLVHEDRRRRTFALAA